MNAAVIIVLLVIAIVGFFIARSSIEKLNFNIFSYYPFDLFIPKEGKWSAVYFIVSIAALFLIFFFLSNLNTPIRPA